MQRMADPSYLATITMSQLYNTIYENRLPFIDDLLYPGTYLFLDAPKVDKSFLMAQITYHASTSGIILSMQVQFYTLPWRMITEACRSVYPVCSE